MRSLSYCTIIHQVCEREWGYAPIGWWNRRCMRMWWHCEKPQCSKETIFLWTRITLASIGKRIEKEFTIQMITDGEQEIGRKKTAGWNSNSREMERTNYWLYNMSLGLAREKTRFRLFHSEWGHSKLHIYTCQISTTQSTVKTACVQSANICPVSN